MAGGEFHQEEGAKSGSFGEAVEMHIFLVAVNVSPSNAQVVHIRETGACKVVAITTSTTVVPLQFHAQIIAAFANHVD